MLPALRTLLALIGSLATALSAAAADDPPAQPSPPRLIVLTDIGGDPDDQQSMIRLMLYSNQLQIEGLIASASGTPGELKQATTRPELIREVVQAYGQVYPRLVKHAVGYPAMDELLGCIQSGNPQRGLRAIGAGHDTEGSQWIINAVDRSDPRPVNIAIWGGQTDLAQALWRVKSDRDEQAFRAFVGKLRIYDIGDQDAIASWIIDQFPGLFYVLAKASEGQDKRSAVFRGMYLGGDESLVSRDWMETHLRQNHGPLGALYPPRTWTAPNPHSAIKEGDTPSWFYFLPHGVNDPANPEWGGWGGRFQKRPEGYYGDAVDRVGDDADARATVWRWRPNFQRDFQARLDWCIADNAANHPPVARLNDDNSGRIVHLQAKPGEMIQLAASGSHDPDGDRLQVRWFVYPEAGTYRGKIKLSKDAEQTTQLAVPGDAASTTIHVVLQVADDGTPPLMALRRAVISVR